jgi:transcriptional regulator with XRE-family HTH domain
MFDLIGETLRRLRKERNLTLDELGRAAELGRGQLSRIENNKQEATLSTLGKILTCQGVSRREFFRRYELVEAEARAIQRQEKGEAAAEENWPEEVREALGKVESLVQLTFHELRPVAQGAVEIGDLVVLFRVVPKEAAPAAPPQRQSEPKGGAPKAQDSKPGRKRKLSRG